MAAPQDLCRSCGAAVRWVRTAASGTLMPLNAAPDPAGNVELDGEGRAVVHAVGQTDIFGAGERWMPHHATCPQAPEWRR